MGSLQKCAYVKKWEVDVFIEIVNPSNTAILAMVFERIKTIYVIPCVTILQGITDN